MSRSTPRTGDGRRAATGRSRIGGGALSAIAALCLLLSAASCNDEKKGDDASAVAATSTTAPAPAERDLGAAKPTGGIPADRYVGLSLEPLNQEERAKLEAIARAELCPCPDSVISLHECLQKEETQCAASKYVFRIIGAGIKQGENQTDILDAVAQYVEAIKKTHTFDLSKTPFKGSADASVVIVEFADFQCPHCRLAAKSLDEVASKYGDKIAVYYKQFPLSTHTEARHASAASLAAHKQGRFWPMHALLFENQSALGEAKYRQFADQLGLNASKLAKDMKTPEIAAQIERDRAEGDRAGITGTPSLFVNGKTYMGDPTSVEELSAYIDSLLKAPEDGEGK